MNSENRSSADLVELASLNQVSQQFIAQTPALRSLVSNGIVSLNELRSTCEREGLMRQFVEFLKTTQDAMAEQYRQVSVEAARIDERRTTALNQLRALVPSAFDTNGVFSLEVARQVIQQQREANQKHYDIVDGIVPARLAMAMEELTSIAQEQQSLLLAVRDAGSKTNIESAMQQSGPNVG